MRSMEFSGPTVDAAIFRGLTEMGVTIDEVEIETIQNESKGIFGFGAKEAVVRLTEREIPLEMEIEQVFQKEERTAKRDERYPKQQRTRSEKTKQDRKRKDERRSFFSKNVFPRWKRLFPRPKIFPHCSLCGSGGEIYPSACRQRGKRTTRCQELMRYWKTTG